MEKETQKTQIPVINIINRYGLSLLLVASLLVIYVNMLFDGDLITPFFFNELEITERSYLFKLGQRLSFSVLCFVIWKISEGNLKWTAFLLTVYWLVESCEFVMYYNTVWKSPHWIVFSVLLIAGFVRNERVRGKN